MNCVAVIYWDRCRRVIKYAKFVEAQHEREEAPGCEMCANNRVTLEKAWQVGFHKNLAVFFC